MTRVLPNQASLKNSNKSDDPGPVKLLAQDPLISRRPIEALSTNHHVPMTPVWGERQTCAYEAPAPGRILSWRIFDGQGGLKADPEARSGEDGRHGSESSGAGPLFRPVDGRPWHRDKYCDQSMVFTTKCIILKSLQISRCS